MDQIVGFVKDYNAYFSMGLLVFSLLLFIYMLVMSSRISRLAKCKSKKLAEASAEEIADAVTEQSAFISRLQDRLDGAMVRQMDLGQALAGCIQKANVVRFNAFEDVGGEQSFALSLLDDKNNGVVISSLYGRQDCRLYVKTITNGTAERALSKEEQQAIEGRPNKTSVA